MTLQVDPVDGWSLNALPYALEVGAETSTIRRLTHLECPRLQGSDVFRLDGVRVGGRPLTAQNGVGWPETCGPLPWPPGSGNGFSSGYLNKVISW